MVFSVVFGGLAFPLEKEATDDQPKSADVEKSSTISERGSRKRNNTFATRKAIDADVIISNLDSIYTAQLLTAIDSLPNEKIEAEIKLYLKSLPKSSRYDDVILSYQEELVNDIQADSLDIHKTLKDAYIYLLLPNAEEKDFAYRTIATMYATLDNQPRLVETLKEFKEYSAQCGNIYDDTIQELTSLFDFVLHPANMQNELKGTWVSLETRHKGYFDENSKNISRIAKIKHMVKEDKHVPFVILDIDDISKDFGASKMRLYPGEKNANVKKKKKNYTHPLGNERYRFSQSSIINKKDRDVRFDFASDKIDMSRIQGARFGVNLTQQLQASLSGAIWSSNMKFGTKLAAGFGADLLTSGISLLLMASAESSMETKVFSLGLNYEQRNLLSGNYYILEKTVWSGGKEKIRLEKEFPVQFVRWEDQDSVMFVSENNKPITLNREVREDDALLTKYNEIQKKYSWKNKKYLVPLLIGEGAGITLAGVGLSMAFKHNSNNKYGPNNNKNKEIGIGLGTMGIVCMAYTPIIIAIVKKVKSKEKDAEFRELNRQNYEKLKRKVNMTTSMGPMIDINTNSFGINLSCKF